MRTIGSVSDSFRHYLWLRLLDPDADLGELQDKILGLIRRAGTDGHARGRKEAIKDLRLAAREVAPLDTEHAKARGIVVSAFHLVADRLEGNGVVGSTEVQFSHPDRAVVVGIIRMLRRRGFVKSQGSRPAQLASREYQTMGHVRWQEPSETSFDELAEAGEDTA